MKKILLILSLAAVVWSCSKRGEVKVYSKGLKFCESVIFYGDTLLVANFGTDAFDPLNNEGMGYIARIDDTTTTVVIPSDGNLSGPKGMALAGSRLFIADVGKVVSYDLADLSKGARVIPFPDGDVFVNDMAIDGDKLYVSVTNTGNIYRLDISDPELADTNGLTLFSNIPGANGLIIKNRTLYIASYAPDGKMSTDNVIYTLSLDGETPVKDKLTLMIGQYDGLALSKNGKELYVTSWVKPMLSCYDFSKKKMTAMEHDKIDLAGPARMVYHKNALWIPDLPNSRVVRYSL